MSFKKGHTAWNKGKKGYTNKGSFKKGQVPWTKGKKFSKEYKAKLSKAHKGKNMGVNHPNWKGGRFYHDTKGYILAYSPNHPNKTRNNYVYEHRLVMEKKLGRYLTAKEIIHHKNGIKDDNRSINLILSVRNKNWHSKTCPNCGFKFLIE